MKRCHVTGLALVFAVTILAALAFAPIAFAQTGQCGGQVTQIASASLSPDQGPAGSSVIVSGVLGAPILREDGSTLWNTTGVVSISWGGSSVASAVVNPDGSFSTTMTVPGDSPPGPHTVELKAEGDIDPYCLTFTVTSVRQDAYLSRTSLPSTGVFLLLAPAGLLAGAGGAAVLRTKRKPAA